MGIKIAKPFNGYSTLGQEGVGDILCTAIASLPV